MDVGTAVRGLSRLAPGWLALVRPGASVAEQIRARGLAFEDVAERADRVRYHLGRGRRAREAGRYERGAHEAREALALNAGNPWAYALLGQCLMRQATPDLVEARHALERACALAPANGYFVRLLLDVLDAQGDITGRDDALAWAWWNGAPVERWLAGEAPDLARATHQERAVTAECIRCAQAAAVGPTHTWHPMGAGARM
ncbi:MAG: hypothetical protein IT305_00290 [Chloroflexi bacterium]|nr:hypothetical protein [Chloroflexota bacterium]